MGLSMMADCPEDVLATGNHLGFDWVVMRGAARAFRCGYIRVPAGHPWHERDREDIDVRVHGSITWQETDDSGEGSWLGFDCGHAWDLPDLDLLVADNPQDAFLRGVYVVLYGKERAEEMKAIFPMWLWTQEMVEAECRSLCEQAADAASSS